MRTLPLSLATLGALGAAAAFTCPASAQPVVVDEIVIMPQVGPDGRPATLSRVVSIRDLDLRTRADQDILRLRIRDTARDLCRELGETGSSPILSSANCVDRAVAGANSQMKLAIAQAFQPRYAVLPPSQYVAPVGDTGAAADASATVPETGDTTPETASASSVSTDASASVPEPTYTTRLVTNGSVPDTPENRARYGQPISNAGKRTSAAGN